jgi:hypothetical protein
MSAAAPLAKPVLLSDHSTRNGATPPLESGDRLTRSEFERRYEAEPGLKKAELIEGVVYLPSPVRQKYHGKPHTTLIGSLFAYRAKTPGVELGGNSTVRMGTDGVSPAILGNHDREEQKSTP